MTFGPSAVAIRPAYRIPVNGVPSSAIACTVGRTIVSIAVSTTSWLICGTGLYAPMPPVFGPLSPSKARLWSCEIGIGQNSVPFTKLISENSWPSR